MMMVIDQLTGLFTFAYLPYECSFRNGGGKTMPCNRMHSGDKYEHYLQYSIVVIITSWLHHNNTPKPHI